MILLAAVAATGLAVGLCGGQLSLLTRLRVRWWGLVFVALGTQFVLVSPIGSSWGPVWLGLAHVGSYLAAGAFVWVNRRLPGLPLMALGGVLNLAAIAANRGVMPAAARAVELAGVPTGSSWSNSAVLDEPRLAFLGDVFAVPAPVPFANVFSVGDVLLVVGAAVLLVRVCLPAREHERTFRALLHLPRFRTLWAALGVSYLGDWIYTLAVAATAVQQGSGAATLATLLIAQHLPGTVAAVAGGPFIDRFDRRQLMLAADVLRAGAVATLVIAGTPTTLHLYVVATVLGVGGALFVPAAQASIPLLVPRGRLVAANALLSITFHVAVLAGPLIGGLLSASSGTQVAFAVNTASFALSALLLLALRLPGRPTAEARPGNLRASLAEGFGFVLATPVIRAVFVTVVVAVTASALRGTVEPLFAFESLGGDARTLGVLTATWGAGMLLGSLVAPRLASRMGMLSLLQRGVLGVGLCVVVLSRLGDVGLVLCFALAAGMANALAVVSYESLLQARVPDRVRGRVMASVEAADGAALLLGAALAAPLTAIAGVRGVLLAAGLLFCLAAVVGRRLLAAAPERAGAASPAARAASRRA